MTTYDTSRDALLSKRTELLIKQRTAANDNDQKVTVAKLTFERARAAHETAEKAYGAAQMAQRQATFSFDNETHRIDSALRALNPRSLVRLINVTRKIENTILSRASETSDYETIHTPVKLAALKAFREWASAVHLLQSLDHDLVIEHAEVLASELPEFAIEIRRAATERETIPA